MKWLAVRLGLHLLVPLARPAALAEDTPASRLPASQFSPDGDALGDGWARHEVSTPFASYTLTDALVDAAATAYGGPGGTRVLLAAMDVTTERVATRTAWEEVTLIFQEFAYRLISVSDVAEENPTRPPAGCQEAKRAAGIDTSSPGFEAGVTLCATAADVILLAVVSGAVGDLRGAAASDRLAALAPVAHDGAALSAG